MVQTMAPNLNELKCSINTLVYLSFITNGPILRLDYLKVFYTSNDEGNLRIFKMNASAAFSSSPHDTHAQHHQKTLPVECQRGRSYPAK